MAIPVIFDSSPYYYTAKNFHPGVKSNYTYLFLEESCRMISFKSISLFLEICSV